MGRSVCVGFGVGKVGKEEVWIVLVELDRDGPLMERLVLEELGWRLDKPWSG